MKMNVFSRIRQSFTAQVTLWVVGFVAVILCVILVVMVRFSQAVVTGRDGSELMLLSLLTVAVSLGVLVLLCWWVIDRHLHPLSLLSATAQRIADGQDEAAVPMIGQRDEIGQLQNSFAKMQQSLSRYMAELQQKGDALSRQNAELQAAYEQLREKDSVKTQFIGRMTAQMGQAVETLSALTERLCDHHAELTKAELMRIQIEMLSNTNTVTRLLDQMLTPPNTPA